MEMNRGFLHTIVVSVLTVLTVWTGLALGANMFPRCVPFDTSHSADKVYQLIDSAFARQLRACDTSKEAPLYFERDVRLPEVVQFEAFPDLKLFCWSNRCTPVALNTKLNRVYLFSPVKKRGTFEAIDTSDVAISRMVAETGFKCRDEEYVWQVLSLYFLFRNSAPHTMVVYRRQRDIDRLIAFTNISADDFRHIYGFPRVEDRYSYSRPFLIRDFDNVPQFRSLWKSELNAADVQDLRSAFNTDTLRPPEVVIRGDTVTAVLDVMYASSRQIVAIVRFQLTFGSDLSWFRRQKSVLYRGSPED